MPLATAPPPGRWTSAEAAAYPPAFNYYVARSISSLRQTALQPTQVAPNERPKPSDHGLADAERHTDHVSRTRPPVADLPQTRLFDAEPDAATPGAAVPLSPTAPTVSPAKRTPSSPAPVPAAPALTADIIAGIKQRVRKAPDRWANLVTAFVTLGPFVTGRALLATAGQADPKRRHEAIEQDAIEWPIAERAKITNHEDNESWVVMRRSDVPRGRALIKLTWAYKNKRSGKRKARLCVQGCSQRPGVDYDQTYSATLRPTSLRTLAAISARMGMRMRRRDFVAAYLQGQLLDGEVVYCTAPAGYRFTSDGHLIEGKDDGEFVCMVQKPIYGMAQAGRRWQRSLYPWLQEQGFKQLFGDSCLFMASQRVTLKDGSHRDEQIILGVYVDDLCVVYSHDDDESLYREFIDSLTARWEVEDEGELTDLLNVEFEFGESSVTLKQTSYITRLVETFLPDGPPLGQFSKVPCDLSLPQLVADALSQSDDIDVALLKQYQSIVGSLLYCATQTRPDVAYAVGMLCRAMGKPTPELLAAAMRVLCYLARTRELGLRYTPDQGDLRGMSDSDWAVQHSTSGFVFSFSSAAISWGSKKQPTIALSSCEAEIVAASESAKEAVHLGGIIDELGLASGDPIEMAVDNTGARDTAYNPELAPFQDEACGTSPLLRARDG